MIMKGIIQSNMHSGHGWIGLPNRFEHVWVANLLTVKKRAFKRTTMTWIVNMGWPPSPPPSLLPAPIIPLFLFPQQKHFTNLARAFLYTGNGNQGEDHMRTLWDGFFSTKLNSAIGFHLGSIYKKNVRWRCIEAGEATTHWGDTISRVPGRSQRRNYWVCNE